MARRKQPPIGQWATPIRSDATAFSVVRWTGDNASHPIRVTITWCTRGGLPYKHDQFNMTLTEATTLCDMLADVIGRNADMPVDF